MPVMEAPKKARRANTKIIPKARYVLTDRRRAVLEKYRSAAKAGGRTVRVEGYERLTYRLKDQDAVTLARWFRMEKSLLALCRDRDKRQKVGADEKELVQRVITLLEDTFLAE